MKPRQKKLVFIVVAVAALALVVGLVLNALKNNVSLYFTPTQVYNKEAPQGRSFRIGGLVEAGSVKREGDGLTVHFVITDNHKSIPAIYKGILPDLFTEGKGVVAQGKIEADGVLHADEVLAKHDENYMPPEAADALKKAGVLNATAAASAPAASVANGLGGSASTENEHRRARSLSPTSPPVGESDGVSRRDAHVK